MAHYGKPSLRAHDVAIQPSDPSSLPVQRDDDVVDDDDNGIDRISLTTTTITAAT